MRSIAATVLDPTHLELTEPLAMRSGVRVEVTVKSPPESEAAPRRLRHREREQAWRQANGDVLRAYAGQWLVLEGEEIVASGADPAELVRQARARGIGSPYLFFVEPSEPGVVKIGL